MESDDILYPTHKGTMRIMRSPDGGYAWQLSRRIKWLAVAQDVREGMWEQCETCQRQHLHGTGMAVASCPRSTLSQAKPSATCIIRSQPLTFHHLRNPYNRMPCQRYGCADDLGKLIRDKTELKCRLSRMRLIRSAGVVPSLGTLHQAARDFAFGISGATQTPSEPLGSDLIPLKQCYHPAPMTPTTIRLIARSIDRHFFHGRFHGQIARSWHRSDLPYFSAEALLPPWIERKPMDSMRPLR